jgi:hypothetical protein
MRAAAAAFALLGAVVVAFACSSSSSAPAECQSGDLQQCTCDGGAPGTKTCSGTSFGACTCAATGTDGGHEGGASTSDSGFGQYMGPCEAGGDCPSGDVCFEFPLKGNICTHGCDAGAQCEPPSPKCNAKGYCAVPD